MRYQPGSQDHKFLDSVWEQTVDAIVGGASALVLWGFNQAAVELIHRLDERGLLHLVRGIVDGNPAVQGTRLKNVSVVPPSEVKNLDLDVLIVMTDARKEEALRSFAGIDVRMPRVIVSGTGHLQFHDELFEQVLASLLAPSHAFGYPTMLIHIYQSLQYLARLRMRGAVAEFGVYKGGTTVFIAKVLNALGVDAKLYAFDTFAGFPARRSVLDLFSDQRDTFPDSEAVARACEPYHVEFVAGDISETFRVLEGIPLMFSFFDTDNYSPTKAALETCYRHTVPGGILAFDHYFCDERWLYTVGERMAIREVLNREDVFNLHGTGIFIRI